MTRKEGDGSLGAREVPPSDSSDGWPPTDWKIDESARAPPDGPSPRAFGDFEILGELGRGGMGIVYLARQKSLERTVALKVLPAGVLAEKAAVARFLREAHVTAGLHHPNIVEIYAMGVHEGVPYYAMEHCEGETLQQVLTRARAAGVQGRARSSLPSTESPPADDTKPAATTGTVTPRRLVCRLQALPDRGACADLAGTFAGAAEGLHHAHVRGIVHRDLKPSNLLLDPLGRLRILDFGLAFQEGSRRLTESRERLGTPLYMSPEQTLPGVASVAPPTDVYGLGATLYEVLTLEPPFGGRSNDEILWNIRQRDPVAVRRLNPSVPRDLETIVLKCLRKSPWERYGTAEALAQDLQRFVRGDPVEARPLGLADRVARRAWRMRRQLVQRAIAVALVLAVAALLVQHLRAAREAARASYEASVRRGLMTMLRRPILESEPKGPRMPLEPLSLAEGDEIDLRFTRREGAHGESLEAGSHLLEVSLRPVDAGPDPVDEAISIFRDASRVLPGEPEAYYHLAGALLAQDRLEEAEREVEMALACRADFLPALALRASLLERMESPAAGDARRVLTEAARSWGDWRTAWLRAHEAVREKRWKEAAKAFGSLSEIQRGASEPYVGCSLEAVFGRGFAFLSAGDSELALVEFGIGRDRARDAIEPELLYAKTLYLRARKAEAEERFGGVRRDAEARWDRDRTPAAAAFVDEAIRAIAAAYVDLGDADAALRWLESASPTAARFLLAAEVLRTAGRSESALLAAKQATARGPDSVAAHLALGNAWLALSGFGAAKDAYLRAGEIDPGDARPWIGLTAVFSAEGRLEDAETAAANGVRADPRSVKARMARARVLSSQDRLEEATQAYEDVLALVADDAVALNNLGIVLDRRGLHSQAIRCYAKAAKARPDLAFVHFNLAIALHRQKDPLGAIESYRTALRSGLDDPTVRGNLAYCLHVCGKSAEAAVAYEAALGLAPDSAMLHHSLGVLRDSTGDMEGAIQEYAKAVALDPEWPDAHNDLGFAYDQVGRFDEAIECYRRVFELDPKSVWAQNNHAQLALRAGRRVPEGADLQAEIRRLEDAVGLPNADPAVATLLDRYRRALLPELASMSSIDWVLEGSRALVTGGTVWKVFREDREPAEGLSWSQAGFDETGWESGHAGAAWSDAGGQDPPRNPHGVLYGRARFTVEDPASVRGLTLELSVSDGCIAYLNGSEVARMRVGRGPEAAAHDGTATEKESCPWLVRSATADPRTLVVGENVLAVQAVGRNPSPGQRSLFRVALTARLAYDRGGREVAREAERSYRAVVAGPRAAAHLAYLAGRKLQEAGDPSSAEAEFRSAKDLEPTRPEPVLRIAECLRARGAAREASEVLRQGLASGLSRFDAVWDAWFRSSVVEEGRAPAEVLPGLSPGAMDPRDHGSDLLWLLDRLAAGDPIRIRCGGHGVTLEGLGTWSRDRFHVDGWMYQLPEIQALRRSSDRMALYTTERYFSPALGRAKGYRIPLPRGTYRVTLRFLEGHFHELGSRIFEVFLEGERRLPDFEPLAAGFGVPQDFEYEVEVDDGALEIEFGAIVENPKLSAFEIVRQ